MFSGIKFSEEDVDDYFSDISSSNNLANIFNSNDTREEKTLKYKPPRQNSHEKNEIKQNNHEKKDEMVSDWNVVHAKVVTAFKLINTENVAQGRIGLAILKNSEENLRIILYKTKTNVLSNTNINPNLKLFLNNNYIQFQDDETVFWSLLFDANDIVVFLKSMENNCIIEDQNKIKSSEKSSQEEHQQEIATNKVELDIAEKVETKNSLLTRMAKMGQAIIVPKFSSTNSSESSDSEKKPTISAKPQIRKHYQNSKSALIPNNANTIEINQHSSLIPYASTAYNSHPLTVQDSAMNVFLSENRTQNSELRMNLSKLDSKIDKVLDRIDILNLNGNNNVRLDKDDEIIQLEEKVLELKKENRGLKLMMREASTNEISRGKLIESEKLVNSLNNELEETKYKILEQEKNIEKLNTTLNDRNKAFEVKLDEKTELINDINLKFENEQTLNRTNQTEYEKLKTENKFLTESLQTIRNETHELNNTILDNNNKIKDLELKNQNIPQEPNVESVVKTILNNLYHKMCDEFSEESYSQNDILIIIGKTIKKETKEGLKKLKN